MQIEVDERELGTILGALRQWQEALKLQDGSWVERGWAFRDEGQPLDIATDGGKFSALTPGEIDALCERINVDQALKCPECGTELRIFCSYTGFEYYVAQIDIKGEVVGPLLSRDNDEWKAEAFQCPKCEWEERFSAHLRAIAESKERGSDAG